MDSFDTDADLAVLQLLDEYYALLESDISKEQWPQFTSLSSPSCPPSPPPSCPAPAKALLPSSPTSIELRGDESDGAPTVSREQRRRQRHRESMAKYRQDKRDRVDGLKDQEIALKRILLQVLAHNKHVFTGESDAKSTLQWYQAKYTELVRVREALLFEQRSLRDAFAVSDQRARALRALSEHVFGRPTVTNPRAATGVWIRYDDGDTPFYYEPIDEATCRKAIALGFKKMKELLNTLPQTQLPRPSSESAQCMGWTIERAFTHTEQQVPVMLFRFSRRVSTGLVTLDEMAQRAWRIYTSPEAMAQSAGSSATTKIVQNVHDDIVVMIRSAPEKQHAGRSRYLSLYHKLQSGDERRGRSEMVFTMLMNRSPAEETSVNHSSSSAKWLKDGCALLRMTQKPGSHSNQDVGVDVEYMGYVEVRDVAHGNHMWAELCLLMLLWERAVVPQRLLVT